MHFFTTRSSLFASHIEKPTRTEHNSTQQSKFRISISGITYQSSKLNGSFILAPRFKLRNRWYDKRNFTRP